MSVQSLSPIKWMGWGGLGGWSRKLNPSGMSVILRARRPASAPSLAWVGTRCIEVNESSALLATIALCWGLTCLCFRPFLKGICGLLIFFAKKIRFFDWPLLCRGSCSLNEMPLWGTTNQVPRPWTRLKKTEDSGVENEHLFSSSNQSILLLLSRKGQPEKFSAYGLSQLHLSICPHPWPITYSQ